MVPELLVLAVELYRTPLRFEHLTDRNHPGPSYLHQGDDNAGIVRGARLAEGEPVLHLVDRHERRCRPSSENHRRSDFSPTPTADSGRAVGLKPDLHSDSGRAVGLKPDLHSDGGDSCGAALADGAGLPPNLAGTAGTARHAQVTEENAEGEEAQATTGTQPSARAASDMIARLQWSYENGYLPALTSLFTADATGNKGARLAFIRAEYSDIFAGSGQRRMSIFNLRWRPIRDQRLLGTGTIQIGNRATPFADWRHATGTVELELVPWTDDYKISKMVYRLPPKRS